MGPEELVLCLQQEACTRDRGIFYFIFFFSLGTNI